MFVPADLCSFENDILRSEDAHWQHLRGMQQTAERNHETKENALNQLRRDGNNARKLTDKLDEKVSQLQDKLEEATPQSGVLERLENQLKEAKAAKELLNNSWMDSVTQLDELNALNRELKEQMDAWDSNITIIKKKVSKADRDAQNLDVRRQDLVLNKNQAVADKRSAESDKEAREKDCDEEKEKLAKHTESALKYFERIPVDKGETYDSLDAKYKRLHKDLSDAQRRYAKESQIV
jgi:structural maintenance of chromosomes protein 6